MKNRNIIIGSLIIIFIATSLVMISREDSKDHSTVNVEITSEMESATDEVENKNMITDETIEVAIKNTEHLIQESMNYLSLPTDKNIVTFDGYSENKPQYIDSTYDIQKYFLNKDSAINFLYQLNITSPNGQLTFGQGDHGGVIIETPKPQDEYQINSLQVDHAESNDDTFKLTAFIEYQAGDTTANRVISFVYSANGQIIETKTISESTNYKTREPNYEESTMESEMISESDES
ncbi:hypothetical protein [Hutsoniella sourekii]|uniref:hypothetical protein n=1 Tax=Hutsoniella sourekii TaxID=87650 RepID=UPI00047F87C7|nr:hypothetical protein [Hutsoniella sourekii]